MRITFPKKLSRFFRTFRSPFISLWEFCNTLSLKFHLITLTSATILGIIIYGFLLQKIPEPLLRVSILDVGQGDAILIQTPSQKTILIDGGPDDTVVDLIKNRLPFGDRHLDMIVATHPDKDHIAGLIPLFDYFDVDHYLSTKSTSETSFSRNLTSSISRESGLVPHEARRGQRIILDHHAGIFLDILFPDQDTSSFSETNETSIVMRLVYQNQIFLFTGDAPAQVEHYLAIYDQKLLQGAVLKLGHHGSKTSTSELFLETIHPQLALISAGKNNTYHHPSEEVITRLQQHQIPFLSTIDEGTITLLSDGKSFWQKKNTPAGIFSSTND
jgi:competence protein ComEC